MIDKILAVLSCKGGVGKSTIAKMIALTLHNMGYKVGILDADIDSPTLPKIIGLPNDVMVAVINDRIVPYEWQGIKVVSFGFNFPEGAPVLWDDSQKQEGIEQIIRLSEWGNLDFLIVDCPSGTGGELYSVLATHPIGGIIVTTPHQASVDSAKRAKAALLEYKTPLIGFIINMAYRDLCCPHCQKNYQLKEYERHEWQPQEIIAELPNDPKIAETNIIPNFEEIVNEILKRLPNLKEVKHYGSKFTSLQRRAIQVAIKKIN